MKVGRFVRRQGRLIQTVVVTVVAYASGVIINLITASPNEKTNFWILLAAGFAICLVMALISSGIGRLVAADQERLRREAGTHSSGYKTLNREINQYISLVREFAGPTPELAAAPIQLMRNACEDLYHTLEAEYGSGVSVSDHIEFEVTFMTKSIADGALTVAAWENRDGRAPKSLARRKTDLSIYEDTETDKLYQDLNIAPRFIKSTASPDYKELYPGQKTRILSSVIYPVVDDLYGLAGTLVVHCDKENFFDSDASKIWKELLEPYTKRLALARVLADKMKESGLSVSF